MDHNILPNPQFELPQPQVKQGSEKPAPLEGDAAQGQATELQNTELPAAPAAISPAQAAQSVAAADPASTASLIPGITPVPTTVPAVNAVDELAAEDGDLIEKAWVQKAKDIVNHTKSDPYRQNNEISKVKKDYIKKRYNKDLKLSDE